jgi:hypothetical protein
MEDKNWPPFFPIIHHDIANEIPANVQKLQYLAFASWLGTYCWLLVLCFLLSALQYAPLFVFRGRIRQLQHYSRL